MRKQRLVVLATALVAAVVVALLWRPVRNELRIERLRLRALADRDKLARETSWDLPESWTSVASEGDAGFFAMARLLEHEDTLVWAEALTVIDLYFAREDHEGLVAARKGTIRDTGSVLAALRERYPFGYLRYLMIPYHAHGTEWRISLNLNCDADESCTVNLDIPPNERSLRFCEDVLQDRVEYPDWNVFEDMHLAAVHGLCGMLPRGRIPDLDAQGRSLENRAVHALRTYVADGSNPRARLHAVKAYLRRIGRDLPASPVLFEDWLALAKLGWPGRSHELPSAADAPPESFFRPASGDFRDPGELAALVRVHDPVVLRILIRLDREDPTFRARLDAAVAAEIPGFGPAPAWRPFEEKAREWLRGKPARRAGAALVLVDIGGEASRQTIATDLARESDPDLRSLLRSCVAALGDREGLDVCRTDLEARLAERLQEFENSRFRNRIGEFPGWGLHDMAANLLRAGDAKLVQRVFELAAEEETDHFAFALAAVVPALPFWDTFHPKSDVERFPPSDAPNWPSRTRLRRWWSVNGPTLRYDPASRTFVLP